MFALSRPSGSAHRGCISAPITDTEIASASQKHKADRMQSTNSICKKARIWSSPFVRFLLYLLPESSPYCSGIQSKISLSGGVTWVVGWVIHRTLPPETVILAVKNGLFLIYVRLLS